MTVKPLIVMIAVLAGSLTGLEAQDLNPSGTVLSVTGTDAVREGEILRRLEEESPLVAEEIKERLFTIDVLEYLEDDDLQKILRDMQDREIALLLKGKSDGIRAKILSSISERRRGFVADEYRIFGAVPKREADEATKEFLGLLRRLEEEGSIVFRRENDRWVD